MWKRTVKRSLWWALKSHLDLTALFPRAHQNPFLMEVFLTVPHLLHIRSCLVGLIHSGTSVPAEVNNSHFPSVLLFALHHCFYYVTLCPCRIAHRSFSAEFLREEVLVLLTAQFITLFNQTTLEVHPVKHVHDHYLYLRVAGLVNKEKLGLYSDHLPVFLSRNIDHGNSSDPEVLQLWRVGEQRHVLCMWGGGDRWVLLCPLA